MTNDEIGGIERVAVIGAGLMGHGIAQTFAMAGLEVCLNDRESRVLEGTPSRIEENLRFMEEVGYLKSGAIPEVMKGIHLKADLASAVEEADYVCESISEDPHLKQELFAALDHLCPSRTILATNTSSLSLTQVGALISRKDRLIATHYLNPPHLVPLVEIARGEKTSNHTLEATLGLMRRCKWVPVVLRKGVPGYIANRLLAALFREAITLVQDGVAGPEEVDLAVKAGFGIRMPVMGLMEVADLAGLHVLEVMLGNLSPQIASQPNPPPLLSEMVERGERGARTGKGFYDWSEKSLAELIQLRDRHLMQMRLSYWEKGDLPQSGNEAPRSPHTVGPVV